MEKNGKMYNVMMAVSLNVCVTGEDLASGSMKAAPWCRYPWSSTGNNSVTETGSGIGSPGPEQGTQEERNLPSHWTPTVALEQGLSAWALGAFGDQHSFAVRYYPAHCRMLAACQSLPTGR